MDSERWDPNAQLICPYDPVHIISVKRYQHHIIKCRKNHEHKDFVSCPFNAKHVILRQELKTHLAHCADRVVLEADVQQDDCPETGEVHRLKGYTAIPEPRYHIPDDKEDWDDEIEEKLAERLQEQKLNHQRMYKSNDCALRKPYLINDEHGASDNVTDNDDVSSVTSSRSRHNYVSINKNGTGMPQMTKNGNAHAHGVGRGALRYALTHSGQKNVGRQGGTVEKQQQTPLNGIGREQHQLPQKAPFKSFGRGTIRETLVNYKVESS